jgi:hypothetical protein
MRFRVRFECFASELAIGGNHRGGEIHLARGLAPSALSAKEKSKQDWPISRAAVIIRAKSAPQAFPLCITGD